MNRKCLAEWRTARTFADLCELTARWIEGDLPEQPGYYGPSDIETCEMVPVLAGLCRAGFMTTQSQAGHAGEGFDGAWWEQRAAVEGFADDAMVQRIELCADAAGLGYVIHCPPPRWSWRFGRDFIPVTWRAGVLRTGFGRRLPRRFIRGTYGDLHRGAVEALCGAYQVLVYDPVPGSAGLLWSTLGRAVVPEAAS